MIMIRVCGLHVESAMAVVDAHEEISEDKRNDSLQLHDDVDGRTRGVLERVTNGISDNGSDMNVGALAGDSDLAIFIRRVTDVALFDVLLGIVPSTTSVRLGDGKLHAGGDGAGKEATDSLYAKERTAQNGRGDDEDPM